jgi:hypothetical protein
VKRQISEVNCVIIHDLLSYYLGLRENDIQSNPLSQSWSEQDIRRKNTDDQDKVFIDFWNGEVSPSCNTNQNVKFRWFPID